MHICRHVCMLGQKDVGWLEVCEDRSRPTPLRGDCGGESARVAMRGRGGVGEGGVQMDPKNVPRWRKSL